MKTRSITLSEDQLEDLAKICDAAKAQAEWMLTGLVRIFDDGERRAAKKTLENFIAGCEVYAEMFRRS